MSVRPAEFLSSARQIAAEDSEIAARNTVSRAYYAAFHEVRSVFAPDSDFLRSQPGGMHSAYIDQLMQAPSGSTMRTVAVKLSSLKGKRTKADYHLGDQFPTYLAQMQIQAAESVFQLIRQAGDEALDQGQNAQVDGGIEKSEFPPTSPTKPRLQRIR